MDVLIHPGVIDAPVSSAGQGIVFHVFGTDQAGIRHAQVFGRIRTHLHQTGIAIRIGSDGSIARRFDDGHGGQTVFADTGGLAGFGQGELGTRVFGDVFQSSLALAESVGPPDLPNGTLLRNLFVGQDIGVMRLALRLGDLGTLTGTLVDFLLVGDPFGRQFTGGCFALRHLIQQKRVG